MKITDYTFGKIQINGKIFSSDIKIINGKIYHNWWRHAGHSICIEDIQDIIDAQAEIIIFGCGAYCVLKVPGNIKRTLLEKGIEVFILNTNDAIKKFNELESSGKRISAGFHLTC